MITEQQDRVGRTDGIEDGGGLLQLLMRDRSAMRMEDDLGLEIRNR